MSLTTYKIPTDGYDINLQAKITAEKGVVLIIKGYDYNHQNSVYFHRELGSEQGPFRGTRLIHAPMPISPTTLNFVVYDKKTKSDFGIKVEDIKATPLKKEIVAFNKPEDHEFFRFAENFVKKCGYITPGVYRSESGKFEIRLSPIIINPDGKISTTPARIFRPSGKIEVSKSHFDKMTIPMRMLILLHEYSHFRANTREEGKADKYALNIYLGMGYPKSEAVYAFTKVFTPVNEQHAEALNARTRDLVNFVKNYQRPQ